jgi:hypothetical protein
MGHATSEWTKALTHPLGLAGYVLFFLFGLLALVKPRDHRRWLVPAVLFAASIALLGGLGLVYLDVHRGVHESAAEAGPGTVGIQLAPSKTEYRKGEQIVISIVLTNREAKACRMSRVTEGAVTVLSVNRDGTSLPPVLMTGEYISGFTSFLVPNLVMVSPGDSLSLLLVSDSDPATGDRAALQTSTRSVSDEASLAFWPVDQSGHYTLTASYLLPPLIGAPPDLCPPSGGPVSTKFTVTER